MSKSIVRAVLEEGLIILGSDYVNEDNHVDYDTVLMVFAELLDHQGISINRADWRTAIKDHVRWLRER